MTFVEKLKADIAEAVRGNTARETLLISLDAADKAPPGFRVLILSTGINEALTQMATGK
jgi:hypothetical protein